MADTKNEAEYIIPLRKEWRKVANYRRTGRAVKFIKQFIARHMKVPDRDVSKVKLDLYLNQEIWFRGRKKPPAKIRVRAKKEGELVKVELAEIPIHVKFLKFKQAKKHKAVAKPEPKPSEVAPTSPTEEKKEPGKEQREGEKKEEKEKAQASAEQKAAQAEQQAKAQQKATKVKETPIHRKALKK